MCPILGVEHSNWQDFLVLPFCFPFLQLLTSCLCYLLQVGRCISWNSRKSELEWTLETSRVGVLRFCYIGKSLGDILFVFNVLE